MFYGETKVFKDLKSYDDFCLIRSITRWVSEADKLEAHHRLSLYVISKIAENWLNPHKEANKPSLLVRILYVIDNNALNNITMTTNQVNELLFEFKDEMAPIKTIAGGNTYGSNKFASSGRTGRSGFQTCRSYNNGANCWFKNCKFAHVCAEHAKIGPFFKKLVHLHLTIHFYKILKTKNVKSYLKYIKSSVMMVLYQYSQLANIWKQF